MTPLELSVYADAWAGTQRQQAYLQALTIRAMIGTLLGGKRAPSFSHCFGDGLEQARQTAKPSGPMTDEAMFDMVRALNAQFGGSDLLTSKKGGEIDNGGST